MSPKGIKEKSEGKDMDVLTARVSEGTKYQVEAAAVFSGGDLTVSLRGGTLPHIGAVSLAVYEPERDSATVSTVTVFSHRDDAVSAPAAKLLAKALKRTVCVSAGLHIDGAGVQELETLRRNCETCCELLLARLRG